jgi:hypothetical protein
VLAVVIVVPSLARAQDYCTANAESVVDAVYRQVLERPVGGEGAELAARLDVGKISVKEIVRRIAKSPEHRQRFLLPGGRSGRAGAITTLYDHLLDRAPDEAGLRGFLLGGQELTAIVDVMLDSPEYEQRFGHDVVPGADVRYCPAGDADRGDVRWPEAERSRSGPVARGRFGGLDRNDDGRITWNEWNGSRRAFDVHDWNNDGVLSGDEATQATRRRVD